MPGYRVSQDIRRHVRLLTELLAGQVRPLSYSLGDHPYYTAMGDKTIQFSDYSANTFSLRPVLNCKSV